MLLNSKLLHITGRKLEAALALIDSGAADQALDAKEQSNLAKRSALINQLRGISKTHQKPQDQAAADLADAISRRVAAQLELEASFRAEATAMGANYSAQYTEVRQRADIERELIDTADARLGRMAFLLDVLNDSARAALTFYPEASVTRPGLRVEFSTNMDEVKAARAVIAQCEAECGAMQHQAIGYADVTARLDAMCAQLEQVLASLQLNPPQLGSDGTLDAPLPWGSGRPSWRVAKAAPQPRQLEQITKAATA